MSEASEASTLPGVTRWRKRPVVLEGILVQVCRAVVARLTGSKPQGEVSVWIDDEGDGDAKVTVAWGAPRGAEKAARGE